MASKLNSCLYHFIKLNLKYKKKKKNRGVFAHRSREGSQSRIQSLNTTVDIIKRHHLLFWDSESDIALTVDILSSSYNNLEHVSNPLYLHP